MPPGTFLGMSPTLQILAVCLIVFAPIAFAGVIFATTFKRTSQPDRVFGANIAGALVGGLSENASVMLGFTLLLCVAVGFYALSAAFGNRREGEAVANGPPRSAIREGTSMHRLVVVTLVGSLRGGPLGAANSSKQFLQVVEGSLGHRYDDQLRDYSEDERKMRWYVLFFRDQVAAIDNYLDTQPRLTQRGRAAVDAIRRVCAEELKLYEGLVAEKRFLPDGGRGTTSEGTAG